MVGQLKEDVAEWYQGLSAHMRIEAMCTLIDLSMPFEIRFLGSLIEHLGRKDFGSLREAESKANSFTNANPDEKKKLLKSLGEVSTGCMINGTQFMNPLMHPTNFNESPGNRPSPTHSSDSKGRQLSISSSEIPLQHLNDHVASSSEPCINSHDALSSKTGSSSKGGSSIASSNHIGCISSEEETESMCIANDHKRRKLILYVSVLQPTNHDCANLYYTVLSDIEDSPALAWLEELDKDAQEEVSLLYTLASRHPAFTFEQRMFLGRVATRVNEVIASKFPSRGNTATPQESAQQSHHLHNNLSSSSPASHPVYINHAPIPQAMDPKYAAATGGYYFFTTPHNYMPAPHQPSSNNGDQQQQLRNTTAVSGPYPAYGPYGPYFISHPPHHHHAQALPHPTALNPHYAQIPIQIPSSSSVVTTPTGPQHQGASNTNVNVPPPSMVASNSNHQLGGSGVTIVSKNPNQPQQQQQQPPSATNSISQQSCLSTPSRTSSVPFQSEANSVDGDSAEESSENCDWNSPESSPFESPPQSLTPSRSQSPPSGIPNSTSVQAVSLSGHSATYLVTSSGSATMVSSSYGPPPPASVVVGPSLPVINNSSSSNCSNSSSSASTIVNKTEINSSSSSSSVSVSAQGFVITTATSSSISPSSSASCTTTASSTGNSNNGHIIHNSVNNSSSNKSNTSLHNTPHSHHPPPPCSSSNSSSNSSLGARNPVKNNTSNQNNNTNQSFSIHPPAPPSGVGSSTVISVSQPPPPQQQQQQMMGPSSVPVHLQQQQNSSVVNNVGVVVSHSMSSANAPPPPLAAFAQQQQQQQNPHGAHNSLGLNTSLPPPPHQNNYHCYPGIQPTSISFGGMNAGAAYRAPSQNVLTRSPYVQTQVANALLNNQMVIKGDVQQQQQQQQQQRGVSHSVHGSLRQKTPIQNTPKRRSNLGGANMSGMALHQNSQSTSASVGGKGDEVSDSSMKDNSNSGSNNISSGNNSRTNEIVVSANPSNNKGNQQQQQQPPPQERTTGGGGGAGGVSGKNYHHVTNGIVNSNSGAGGAVLPGNPLPNSNSVVINNPPPPPQSINSSSNPGGQIMPTPNKVASEDGLLGDGGNAVLENYSAAPVNQLPYHMNGPQLYGHPPGHYIQLPNGYMTSSYYPPAMAAAAAAAAAAAMGGGPVPPSTEIMMNPAGVPHFSFPFTIPQSFSSPQQQQQQQQGTGGNKMSNNAKDSVKNNSQQQQNNQQGGSSGDNKVIDGHVGGGGLPAYNPVGPSYYTTTTTGRNPSNRNSNRGVILDIGGALGNSSLSPVNVVDLALLPPLDEIAETVHRPRKPSCYNCGASNHLGPECKEGSMEEMTRHQFRVNYSGPASVTADGKDGD